MADDKKKDNKPQDFSSDSGLGNLPPLSDFDSQSGISSDSGLPPLSSFDSDISRTPSDAGGLPPISDIEIQTPMPTGGNVRPSPPGFGAPKDTFSSGGLASSGGGFQDLAADSDFSPETPEIGPGPDSNVDTPMFDSAFGGGSGGFSAAVDTPAPTQAMETPMFGASGPLPSGGGGGFGGGDFGGFGGGGAGGGSFGGGGGGSFGGGGGGMDFNVGTPSPDFSPDTEMGGKKGGKKAAKGGGGGSGALIGAAAVALIIGILAGPYVSEYVPTPSPAKVEVARLTGVVQDKDAQIKKLQSIPAQEGGVKVSPEEEKRLLDAIAKASADLTAAQTQLDTVSKQLEEQQTVLTKVEQDVQDKTAEFVTLQEDYESLENETAIVQARQRGLISEVERLTNQVGELDEANLRAQATKESLVHAANRLAIQVQESIPLTPDKYNHADRVAAANDLRTQVQAAPYVTPAVLEAYTSLYLKEMEIAQAKEYFFARIPVTDSLGTLTRKWAECVMQGNWSVRYRSIDGQNVGTFENLGTSESPKWGVKEDYLPAAQREIAASVEAARTPNFEQAVAVLMEKEKIQQGGTTFQKNFDSL
jgi:hypothetical protein